MTGKRSFSRLFRGRSAWTLWLLVTLVTAVALAQTMTGEEATRELFLPGKTTHGHYQIELECAACHTDSFASTEDFQTACVECHGEELDRSEDSHPASKFTDPRNADRVEQLDARYCVTCHSEHQPARTGSMGLSLPGDYCYHCHEDVAEERPSHEGMAFDSCADAGCHNFHDNKALYEDYLVKHGKETMLLAEPERPSTNKTACPAPERHRLDEEEDLEVCESCHLPETRSWFAGKHGMRVARGLSPMTPEQARLPMEPQAAHAKLGCGSCHLASANQNLLQNEVQTCEGCHADEHTRAFRGSKHFKVLRAEQKGAAPLGSGVSCATCHLPRLEDEDANLWVNHNQNDNLRPNEKMIRTVCNNCHGVPFAIDALADAELIKKNFSGRPSKHVKSVDLALARD